MAKGIYKGISAVARKTKSWWIGIDGSTYRYLANVPIGETISIGGDLFTVVSHSYSSYGFTGQSVLWAETPTGQAQWTDIFKWGEKTGVDSAFNDTITDLAIKNGSNYKFRVLTDDEPLSGVSAIRYSSGTAVNHWMREHNVGYTLVEENTGSDGEWVGPSEYRYGPYYFYYWDTNGVKQTISVGGAWDEDVDPVYPGASYYYFYACEVSRLTPVTYNANTGYWELFE